MEAAMNAPTSNTLNFQQTEENINVVTWNLRDTFPKWFLDRTYEGLTGGVFDEMPQILEWLEAAAECPALVKKLMA